MPRDGSIGRETFEKVEALTADGGSKSDAFKRIAQQTGRSPGTVAANYYRVARAHGTVTSRRRGRKSTAKTTRKAARATTTRTNSSGTAPTAQATARTPRRRTSRPRSAGSGSDLDRLAAQLVSSVQELAEAMNQQQSELSEMRGRLDGVRQLLA